MADHKLKGTLEESLKDILAAKNAKDKDDSKKKDDKKSDKSEKDDDDDEDKKNGFEKMKDKMKEKKKDVKEETESLEEDSSSAQSSLKPNSRPASDDKAISQSKVSAMSGVMHLMNGMNKGDMLSFFDQVQSQFGPGKDKGVADNSEKNRSTLNMKGSKAVGHGAWAGKDPMPKLNVKEDLDTIFDGTELTEDFKDSATTLFEAAIASRLVLETARLEEEYHNSLTEELATFAESLTEKIDSYLDFVVESWIKENEVAIESEIRSDLTTDFISGLKNLFAEHYIEVPEEKVNVLDQLAEKVLELESKLDETISENSKLNEALAINAAKAVFEEVSDGLALTQQEKFASLAEGIDFSGDIDLYTKKLNIIKEKYFTSNDSSNKSNNINEEVFESDTTLNESTRVLDPNVNRYVSALNRSVKNQKN